MTLNSAKVDLSLPIKSLNLKTPLILASGIVGYGDEYKEIIDYSKVGALITKGLSLKPKTGNPPPRIAEVYGGMLNSIGLENVGFENFIKEKLPLLEDIDTPVIVNIFGKNIEEYGEIAKKLNPIKKISAVEINVSCPNVKEGGIEFGSNPDTVYKITTLVRSNYSKTLIVKLTPAVSDIVSAALVAENGGADALTLINTIPAMGIDIQTKKPLLGAITGGLSGKAIKPVALYCVYRVSQKVNIPVIGCGGISSWEDAIEFILAGATAFQLGTAIFTDPHCVVEIVQGIEKYLSQEGFSSLRKFREKNLPFRA